MQSAANRGHCGGHDIAQTLQPTQTMTPMTKLLGDVDFILRRRTDMIRAHYTRQRVVEAPLYAPGTRRRRLTNKPGACFVQIYRHIIRRADDTRRHSRIL